MGSVARRKMPREQMRLAWRDASGDLLEPLSRFQKVIPLRDGLR